MQHLTRTQSDTLEALKRFGLATLPESIHGSGAGITFVFANSPDARQILSDRALFAQGRLGILHSRAVGGVITEFRSYRTGGEHSLHVVIGKGNRAFADLDRFNPYQGAAGLLAHGFLELAPHLARRLAMIFSR